MGSKGEGGEHEGGITQRSMKPKISMIALGVNNVGESLIFYRDILGFPTHNYREGDEHIMFCLEGSWMSIYPKDKLAKDATVSSEGSGFSGFSLAHNVSSEKEVTQLIASLKEKGVKIVKEPQKVFWGGYSAYFSDPNGYLWEVAYNPFTDLS